MTPLEINLCLHYGTSGTDHDWIHSGAPIVDEVMCRLCDEGLLMRQGATVGGPKFSRGPKLTAYIAMLIRTPLPVAGYFDPRDQAAGAIAT